MGHGRVRINTPSVVYYVGIEWLREFVEISQNPIFERALKYIESERETDD